MSKRDNPRRKQREEEKRARYLQVKEARERKWKKATEHKSRETGRVVSSRISRAEKEYAPLRACGVRTQSNIQKENSNLIIGRNPVMEAVKSGRTIEKILMQKDGEGSIKKIAALARQKGLTIQYVERTALDRLAQSRGHQGIAAFVSAYSYCELTDILRKAEQRGEDPFVILLDGLEDPHNLGAIMRTADAVGAHGIVIPNRRAVGLTETVAKASAGAIEYVCVAKVVNMAAAIDELKAAGLWIGACDMDGKAYDEARLSGPIGLVIGGEGQGVSRLVRERCDFVLSIPMVGKISSLNASNAAAVLMYEVFRQRTGGELSGKNDRFRYGTGKI